MGETVEVRRNMNNEKKNSPVTGSQPVVLNKEKKKSGQGDWLSEAVFYAVKPAVPSKHERTQHKGSMRVDDDELTATLVTTRGYIVEG